MFLMSPPFHSLSEAIPKLSSPPVAEEDDWMIGRSSSPCCVKMHPWPSQTIALGLLEFSVFSYLLCSHFGDHRSSSSVDTPIDLSE